MIDLIKPRFGKEKGEKHPIYCWWMCGLADYSAQAIAVKIDVCILGFSDLPPSLVCNPDTPLHMYAQCQAHSVYWPLFMKESVT